MSVPSCLVDSNILLRITQQHDPQHHVVTRSIERLVAQRTFLCYTHQNIAEIWNVLTRPVAHNGFGLSAGDAEREVRVIESRMELLPENEHVYYEWRRIVTSNSVLGVQVYDARLIAAMAVHGIKHILTFDVSDFTRYAGITVLHPAAL